jgi:hypothetical protein
VTTSVVLHPVSDRVSSRIVPPRNGANARARDPTTFTRRTQKALKERTAKDRMRRQVREQIRRDVERLKQQQQSQPPIPKVTQKDLEALDAAAMEEAARAGVPNEEPSLAPMAPRVPDNPRVTGVTFQKDTETGWDQGDGRWAFQIAHESLSPAQRARLQLVKGTHFRFPPEDEAAFLHALEGNAVAHAEYHAKGKRDVTLTNAGGSILGQIHLLHVDKKDLHRPEAYYMKFYLYNFDDKGTLDATANRIRAFLPSWQQRQPQQQRQQRQLRQYPTRRLNRFRGKNSRNSRNSRNSHSRNRRLNRKLNRF